MTGYKPTQIQCAPVFTLLVSTTVGNKIVSHSEALIHVCGFLKGHQGTGGYHFKIQITGQWED